MTRAEWLARWRRLNAAHQYALEQDTRLVRATRAGGIGRCAAGMGRGRCMMRS